jgi:hypothetical protein
MSGHPETFDNSPRAAAGADGAGSSVSVGLPVCLGTTFEPVSFDSSGEPAALGQPHGVNAITRLEYTDVELLSHVDFRDIVGLRFPQVAKQLACLLKMAAFRLAETSHLFKAELYTLVAVVFSSLDLSDGTRTHLYGGDADGLSTVEKDLRGPYFLSYEFS